MLAVIVYIVLVIIGMFIMVKGLEAHNWKSYRTPSDDYPVTNALFTSLVISAMYAWIIISLGWAWPTILLAVFGSYSIIRLFYEAIAHKGRSLRSVPVLLTSLLSSGIVIGGLIWML
jgi:hypothetical protein